MGVSFVVIVLLTLILPITGILRAATKTAAILNNCLLILVGMTSFSFFSLMEIRIVENEPLIAARQEAGELIRASLLSRTEIAALLKAEADLLVLRRTGSSDIAKFLDKVSVEAKKLRQQDADTEMKIHHKARLDDITCKERYDYDCLRRLRIYIKKDMIAGVRRMSIDAGLDSSVASYGKLTGTRALSHVKQISHELDSGSKYKSIGNFSIDIYSNELPFLENVSADILYAHYRQKKVSAVRSALAKICSELLQEIAPNSDPAVRKIFLSALSDTIGRGVSSAIPDEMIAGDLPEARSWAARIFGADTIEGTRSREVAADWTPPPADEIDKVINEANEFESKETNKIEAEVEREVLDAVVMDTLEKRDRASGRTSGFRSEERLKNTYEAPRDFIKEYLASEPWYKHFFKEFVKHVR